MRLSAGVFVSGFAGHTQTRELIHSTACFCGCPQQPNEGLYTTPSRPPEVIRVALA